MIDLKEYGYRSPASFLKSDVSLETFDKMSNSGIWKVEKSVLLHKQCPVYIKERFSQSPIWYKRLVTYFAKSSPKGYWKKAFDDKDGRIRKLVTKQSMIFEEMDEKYYNEIRYN